MATSAIVFDFNGTLSDDEPLLCEIFVHLFAEHGKPLSAQQYFDELAGRVRAHVDLDVVGTELDRALERRERVLRQLERRAAVSYDKHDRTE